MRPLSMFRGRNQDEPEISGRVHAAAMHEANSAFAQLNPPEALRRTITSLWGWLGASHCCLHFIDEADLSSELVGAGVAGCPARNQCQHEPALCETERHIWNSALRAGRALSVREREDPALAAFAEEAGFASMTAIPLTFRRTPFAVVNAYFLHDRGAPSGAVSLCEAAGVAVYGAVQEELRLASERAGDDVVEAFTNMVEARDGYAGGHTRRVTGYAVELGRAHGLDAFGLRVARKVALLHDLGKAATPDAVLSKPGPLNDQEWEVMRSHARSAAAALGQIEGSLMKEVAAAIAAHHEHWDGSGHPARLAGEAIPAAARIVAIADAFDALTTERPYRAATGVGRAVEILRGFAGTQFDPNLVELFVSRRVWENVNHPTGVALTFEPPADQRTRVA